MNISIHSPVRDSFLSDVSTYLRETSSKPSGGYLSEHDRLERQNAHLHQELARLRQSLLNLITEDAMLQYTEHMTQAELTAHRLETLRMKLHDLTR